LFDAERVALDKERKTVAIDLEEKKANLANGSKDGIRLFTKNAEALTINDTECSCASRSDHCIQVGPQVLLDQKEITDGILLRKPPMRHFLGPKKAFIAEVKFAKRILCRANRYIVPGPRPLGA